MRNSVKSNWSDNLQDCNKTNYQSERRLQWHNTSQYKRDPKGLYYFLSAQIIILTQLKLQWLSLLLLLKYHCNSTSFQTKAITLLILGNNYSNHEMRSPLVTPTRVMKYQILYTSLAFTLLFDNCVFEGGEILEIIYGTCSFVYVCVLCEARDFLNITEMNFKLFVYCDMGRRTHSLTHSLTHSWSWAHLEKLSIVQLL
jgi:hypothetical protein